MIKNSMWYDELVGECKAILTETIYRSRQELIEGKHLLGERICADPNFRKMQGNKKANLQQLFKDIGIGISDGYACVQFYEKYPNLSTLTEKSQEQKNLSWEKIKRTYLPTRIEQKEECLHENIIKICNDCKIRVK